jgi:hypothetical protein
VFWAPRIFTILFALFLSVFALDVFAETSGFLETLIALTLHLLPAILVVVLLVFAWRREMIGVIAFAGLAVAYVVLMWRRGFPLATYVMISGALLLISVLFLLSRRQRLHARNIK